MIPIAAAHRPALAAGTQCLARAWRITTTQAYDEAAQLTWRFSDLGRNARINEGKLEFGLYEGAAIAWGGPSRRVAGLRENTSEVTVLVGTGSNPITREHVESGLLGDAIVDEFYFNPLRLWLPPIAEFRWRVADHNEGDEVKLDLVGLTSRLKLPAGNDIGPTCRNRFMGAFCDAGASLSGDPNNTFGFREYRVDELDGGNTRRKFLMRDGPAGYPLDSRDEADWWAHGLVRFLSGRNAGTLAVIESNTLPAFDGTNRRTEVTLATPLAYPPEPEAEIEVRVGCDGAKSTCKVKFGNLDNFRAAESTPGSDAAMRTPSAQ